MAPKTNTTKGGAEPELDMAEIMEKAKKKALRGGVAGMSAMGFQVCSLIWLRTTMNYQYRNGTTFPVALKTIYKQGGGGLGGIRRFYRGVGPALFQGPLSRFGDTAANAGVLAVMDAMPETRDLPVLLKTMCASLGAASWRIFLMPIDACKTSLQVEGKNGLKMLANKMRIGGPKVLWYGAGATVSASWIGHFPWFGTFNYLDANLPKPKDDETLKKLGRRAFMGFTASIVSDTCSNSIRVLKTYKQTYPEPITYAKAYQDVVKRDGRFKSGIPKFFVRGLETRIIANGLQGLMFSVLWKSIEEYLNDNEIM